MTFYLFVGFIQGIASISFGFWQHNIHAGIWMFMLLFSITFIIDCIEKKL